MRSPKPELDHLFSGLLKLAEDLRPGDILLMTPKPAPSNLGTVPSLASRAFLAVSTDLQGEHPQSAIYTGNGHVVEARLESGITKKPLAEALKGVRAVVVRPDVSTKERRTAARNALRMHAAGLNYDLAGLGRALAQELGIPTREKKQLDAVTCSTLISNAYESKLVDKPKSSVMPADFLRTARTKIVGRLGGSHD